MLSHVQGRGQEFTKGRQTRGLQDWSPQRGPGAEYENPREHQLGRDKNWPTVTADMHPSFPSGCTPCEPVRCQVFNFIFKFSIYILSII